MDVNDIAAGTNFAIVAHAPVDSLDQFRGTVAGQVASGGPGGGGQFQLITKSGSNKFHGNINEYHRDGALAANSWFNDLAHVAKPKLIQNQFGGNIGGPILRDRAFFFFDYNQSRIIQSQNVSVTVPLDSFRNGQINYINNSIDPNTGAACGAASRLNLNPSCISTLTSAQVAALDPQHIGFDPALLTFINSRYPHANDLTLGNGINTGGFRFTAPIPSTETTYVGKVDYNLTSNQKIFVRGTINRNDATQTAIQFAGDPVTHPFIDRSYSYVASHIWTLGANKVNQFYYGDVITKYNFANTYNPTGNNQFTIGGLTNPYGSGSVQKRRVPVPEVRDDFNWTIGSHSLDFGGTFKFIKTHSQLINDFNFVTLGLGGNTATLNRTLRPADIRAVGSTGSSTYDTAFTAALGRIGAISSNYNYSANGTVVPQGTGAQRHYRYYQTELYIGDTWKVTKNLTLNYGLRYQIYTPPYETTGIQSQQNLGFDQYFAARLAQSNAGLAGNTALPLLTYTLAGKANNGPSVFNPNYKDFAPRFAFAYNPAGFKTLVINGSAGIVYDRTVINAINFIQDQSSYLFQQIGVGRQYGTVGNANASLLNDPRISANLTFPTGVVPPSAPAPTSPYTPGVSASGNLNGLANNLFSEAVDPNLKDPYNIDFNLGVQQEFPHGFLMKLNYVNRLGRRLIAQADASQLIDFPDSASQQLMSQAFSNLVQQARANVATPSKQPWFENQLGAGGTQFVYSNFLSLFQLGDFADTIQALSAGGYIRPNVGLASQFAGNTYVTNKGFSSYNGLLFSLQKNFAQGLQFDFNYTWSHSIDNTSQVANSISAGTGYGFICDVVRPRNCRGNSDFDVQNFISSDFTYLLPVGRGRTFMSKAPVWLDEAIGGWSVSGLPSYRSGLALTTSTEAYVAGYANNAPALFVGGNRSALAAKPHKDKSGAVQLFADPTAAVNQYVGPIGFQIGSRNNLRTPSSVSFDASLAKTFALYPDRVSLKFKADAFNVLNHPVFTTANTDIASGSFGQLTGVAVSARVLQVSGRIEF